MRFVRLAVVPLIVFAMGVGAWAQEDTIRLRIKSDDGQIKFFHDGKRLTDSKLNQLCADSRSRKVEIEFQRDKMTGDDALAAILKEAQCLGATHNGSKRLDR